MSVDCRTRIDSEQMTVQASEFFQDILPQLLETHQDNIAPGARELPLKNFCIESEGSAWTLIWQDGRALVKTGHHQANNLDSNLDNNLDNDSNKSGTARVRLSPDQLTDLINDQSTPIALMTNQLLDMPEGNLADFLNWWLVLRAALDGRRIYKAGDISFSENIQRSFCLEDSDEEMRGFLEEMGYLHIKNFFSKEEMAAVEADFEVAAPHFHKGDPKAWHATLKDGEEMLVRMEGFDRYSPTLTKLLDSDRFQRIGRIPGINHVAAKEVGRRAAALMKPIGVVQGISDVPWHKDCSLGRHSYECNSMTVGISITGADANSGQLRVLPGSHRALIWPAPCMQPELGLEPVDLPTNTGDVTVHLSCTQHMSQPPVNQTRKVVYTGFGQEPVDPEQAQRNRERINAVRAKTHVSISQQPGYMGDEITEK